MRILLRARLPLGEGVLLDPFTGSGSTIAAAQAVGYDSLGVELDADYFRLAGKAIPLLASLYPDFTGSELEMEAAYRPAPKEDEKQLSMALAEPAAPYWAGLKSTRSTTLRKHAEGARQARRVFGVTSSRLPAAAFEPHLPARPAQPPRRVHEQDRPQRHAVREMAGRLHRLVPRLELCSKTRRRNQGGP